MALLNAREPSKLVDKEENYPSITTPPFLSWPTHPPGSASGSSTTETEDEDEHGSLTISPYPLTTANPNGPSAITSTKSDYPHHEPSGTGLANYHGNKGASKAPVIAAVAVPIVCLAIIFGAFICCIRRRRRRRAQRFAMRETKELDTELESAPTPRAPDVQVYSAACFAQPPPTVAPVQSVQPEVPIILAPINSSSHAYYTGLDTSDVMSVTSVGTRTTHLDEPPPPYRPRSIAAMALSRDPSIRQPGHVGASNAKKDKDELRVPQRSPFADPSDDDAISEISIPVADGRRHRDMDEFSMVSDLSYQDSLAHRPSVHR